MVKRSPILRALSVFMALAFVSVFALPASAEEVVVRKGTEVKLVFDTALKSKAAKKGDVVRFHVDDPVVVDGQTVIPAGTKVSGKVVKVNKRGRYGVNATVQLKMNKIKSATGEMIQLQPKTKGQIVGARTGEAAAATVGGAILLGPLGLAAGYFIVGKTVNAKPGDKATVEVAEDVALNL